MSASQSQSPSPRPALVAAETAAVAGAVEGTGGGGGGGGGGGCGCCGLFRAAEKARFRHGSVFATRPDSDILWPWRSSGLDPAGHFFCPGPGRVFSPSWTRPGIFSVLDPAGYFLLRLPGPGRVFSPAWTQPGIFSVLDLAGYFLRPGPGRVFSPAWTRPGIFSGLDPAGYFRGTEYIVPPQLQALRAFLSPPQHCRALFFSATSAMPP